MLKSNLIPCFYMLISPVALSIAFYMVILDSIYFYIFSIGVYTFTLC